MTTVAVVFRQALRGSTALSLIAMLSVLLFEFVGLFIFRNFYNWDHKYLFIGEHNYRQLPGGVWTYEPHVTIRAGSVFGFGIGKPWLESECSWETNAFGLINTTRGTPAVADVLVLGDSFTEGEGGCPWITEKTVSALGETVVNGGLGGTSIAQFRMLEQFLSKQLQVKDVVVVAISQDFFRTTSNRFVEAGKACLKGFACDARDYTWAVRDRDWDRVVELTKTRIAQRHPGRKRRWGAFLEWHSLSAHLAAQISTRIGPPAGETSSNARTQILEHQMRELTALHRKYPGMRVILVPQRDEVGLLGRKNVDTRLVERRLQDSSITYERCEIGADDYMYIDGHPNKRGYRKMFKCVFGRDMPASAMYE